MAEEDERIQFRHKLQSHLTTAQYHPGGPAKVDPLKKILETSKKEWPEQKPDERFLDVLLYPTNPAVWHERCLKETKEITLA